MGMKRTGKMPNRGKLLAPIEKAPCPCWASSLPRLGIFPVRFMPIIYSKS